MRKILFVAILMLGFSPIYAQKISGTIQNDSSKVALEFAVVTLLNANDSAQLGVVTTTNAGAYKFTKLKKGEYILQVSFVGYRSYSSLVSLESDSANVVHDVALKQEVSVTNTITIKAAKSPIKQQAGQTTIDVASMTSATGLMALDLLRRMPGVLVDNDDNISLKGRNSVSIMLDGKMTYLSTKQVAQILKSMPASDIDNIEIITAPSAKYDAQGTGGIININLKKTVKQGFSGNVQGGYGQGFYPKYNGGINLAYNTGKWKLNTSYNYRRTINRSVSNNYRDFGKPVDGQLYDNKGVFGWNGSSQTYTLGATYQASKKLSIGFSHYGVLWGGNWRSNEGGVVLDSNLNRVLDNHTVSDAPSKGYAFTNSADFNFKIDSTSKLTGAVSYLFSGENGNSEALVEQTKNGIRDSALFESALPESAQNFSANVDYEKSFSKKFKFESGLKWVFGKRHYNYQYDITQKNKIVPAVPSSALYDYQENLGAAYVQSAYNTKLWGMKLGVRSEYWLANGKEQLSGFTIHRNFLQFFPSASFNYNISEKHNVSFAYTKRISRPNAEMMSPVSYFGDPYSLFSGNPQVLPAIFHSLELAHSFADGALVTTAGYARGINIIQEYAVSQRDTSSILDMTTINIPLQESYTLSMAMFVPIKKWWTLQLYGIVIQNRIAGYLSNANAYVDNTFISANFSATSTFNLAKRWTIEASGFYQMKHLAGYTINDDLGYFALALKKDIYGGRGSVKLNCQDIFHTMKYSGTSVVNGFTRKYFYNWDNQVLWLTFNWKLGSKWFLSKEKE
jgi:iron complex outermembrane receptor protein